MKLSPHYGSDPLIVLDGGPADVLEPLVRQRRRFVQLLDGFDESDWERPTRCEAWSARDVVAHLGDTDAFFATS